MKINQNNLAGVIWEHIKDELPYADTKIYTRKFALQLALVVINYIKKEEKKHGV